jgi:transposase
VRLRRRIHFHPVKAALPNEALLRTVLMDSDGRIAQLERLEVVDTGRRRRWSEDEKLKIVLESLQAPRQVAATARRYGVSRSLLLRWRRSFRPEPKDAAHQTDVVPAMVVAESGPTPSPVRPAGGGAIKIEFAAATSVSAPARLDELIRPAIVPNKRFISTFH